MAAASQEAGQALLWPRGLPGDRLGRRRGWVRDGRADCLQQLRDPARQLARLRYSEGVDKPVVKPQVPMVFDLGGDPGERFNLFSDRLDMGWMAGHRPAGCR
jgi:hypothetical protein